MSLFQNSLGFLPPYFGSGLGQRNFGFVKSAVAAANPYIVATGGTVIQSGDYKVHIFSATDNFIVTSLSSTPAYNLLKVNVVAGGGGGASYAGGGGGAGGFIENLAYSLSSGATTYSCVVGSGGTGTGISAPHGVNGNDSTFDLLQSFGGGGGGSGVTSNHDGQNGGSGGGGAWAGGIGGNGTLLQGKNGGSSIVGSGGCGGGGSSTNGANSTALYNGSNGGAGSLSSITGVYYAGGGGGAGDVGKLYGVGGIGGGGNGDNSGGSGGVNGTVNTGGGGGGDWYGNLGGNGGLGIIVISYYSLPQAIGPYTTAWKTIIEAGGGSLTTPEVTAFTTFENTVGTDLFLIDRLVIFAANNPYAAKVSFTNPSSAISTWVNSPTHDPGHGLQGNGTTSYVTLNYTPTTDGVNYILNNACMGFGSLIAPTSVGLGLFGSLGQTGNTVSSIFYGDNTSHITAYLNASGLGSNSVASTITGRFMQRRTNNLTQQLFKNGSQIDSANSPVAVLMSDISYAAFRRSYSPSGGDNYSNIKLSYVIAGSGNINQANLDAALATLSTTLGW